MEEIKGKYQLPKADQEEFTEAVMNLLKVTVDIAQNKSLVHKLLLYGRITEFMDRFMLCRKSYNYHSWIGAYSKAEW